MFTGLVTDVGSVTNAEHRNGLLRLEVESAYVRETIEIGASIMHSGVCLTVVELGDGPRGASFICEAVPETLEKTMLGKLVVGSKVNLELSLKLGDELGGHLVYGHVDAVAKIVSIEPEGQSWRMTIRPTKDLAKFFATKGSVAIDGVSLTVADVLDTGDFQVAVIPHTLEVTTLGDLKAGDAVNLEVDMLARYVARMVDLAGKD